MIIVHEGLPKEAKRISRTLNQVYGLRSQIVCSDLCSAFVPIPRFNGFKTSGQRLSKYVAREYDSKKYVVVTPRDIYFATKRQDDDWIF